MNDTRARQERFTRTLALSLVVLVYLLLLILSWPRHGSTAEISILLAGNFVAMIALYLFLTRQGRTRAALRNKAFPKIWEGILNRDVAFFRALDESEKGRFREEIKIFLNEKQITGIKTSVDDTVRILVAASAIIPTFGFPEWEWDQIQEILIYPTNFDEHYKIGQKGNHDVLGMIGSGAMNRMMILSKPDLIHGFQSTQDQKNVGIHEFVHLMDKSDGTVDGIPNATLPINAVKPWLQLVHKEMTKIANRHSDINPYALTSEAEFFAVTSEYFFENPQKMKKKHPALHTMLERIFRQNSQARIRNAVTSMLGPKHHGLGRNVPCPCGSGKKYKHCCLD